jgi:hypothetical protein
VHQALADSQSQAWSAEAAEFFSFISEAKRRGVCALLKSAYSENSESEGG